MASDNSSFADLGPPTPATATDGFESECFDAEAMRARYGIDAAKHCWAEVAKRSRLYHQLTAFLGAHGEQPQSFAPKVGVQRLSEIEELVGTAPKAMTVALNCGLGLVKLRHTFADGREVVVKALHQRRGPIVGGNCGAETWENLVVFVEGADNRDALKAFLEYIANRGEEDTPDTYNIYRWHVEHEYWKHAGQKTSRHIDSVVLPAETKDKVIGDLNSFLSKESFHFYSKHGIPYKRSYLFYGVPGAGKTSLLTAIAGKYKRNLCIMQPTDPKVTDDALAEAIKEAPSRSIIVLEDVDALFDKNRDTKNPKMNISFSGLLNALDGVSNPDGQIFVLTTNFRENLDSALIRNGRVDQHVQFSHATAEQIEQLFLQFYSEDPTLAKPFREAVLQELGDKPVNMAALQHFFIREMRTPARDVTARVHSIVEDLNEKNASAAAEESVKKEKDAKEAEKKEQDATVTAAASSCKAAGTAASQNVVHVHVHTAVATPADAVQ